MSNEGVSGGQGFLERLAASVGAASMEPFCERVAQLQRWSKSMQTHVLVCGEFNRGKSSLVNSLLGSKVCPVDALPETAVPFIIGYGDATAFCLHFRDGSSRSVSGDELSRYSLKTPGERADIGYVSVAWPSPILAEGVVLIDTPGVNDLSSHGVDFSYGYLPFADAALVLLDSTAPVTRTEYEFLTDHVLRQVSERIIFVLAKCDRLTPEELEESIQGAKARLHRILGVDPIILPFSTRGSDHGAQLQGIKQQLLQVVERGTADRVRLSDQRARQLASEALAECEARIAISSLDPLEKTTALVRIESEKTQLLAKVEDCRDFADLFGKETLRRLIIQSLAILKENLEADLMHHIDVATGRIDEFVKKEVPYRIATALRQWSNAKSSEIQVFLMRLADRISGDCAKAFGSKLQVDHGLTSLDMPSFTVSTESTDSDRMKAMIADHLLPSALPMLAGYLLLGPLGILAGSFLGRIAEFGVSERELSNQRTEARTIVPQQVNVAFSAFEEALNLSINRWFTELHTLVRTEAERRARDAEDRWNHSQNESHDRLLRAAADLRELVNSPQGAL